jgi:hypothetical protein
MRATPEGTRRFAERQPPTRQSNYRQATDGLWLSSLGHGTYLGEADDATDAAYRAAFSASLGVAATSSIARSTIAISAASARLAHGCARYSPQAPRRATNS